MRGRTILLLVLALVLAGTTAILVRSRLTQPQAAPVAAAAAPRQSVLVARVPIGRGQIMKSEDLSWQGWPEGAANQAYILKDAGSPDFVGWVARAPFVAGQPIIKAELVAPGERGFLAAVLSPGMRAVSVSVSATSGIAGLVSPGDRVDVLITHALPAEDPATHDLEARVAETILHDVRVIAIDQHLETKRGEAMPAHTVTLEVTPKQSEVIALASNLGQLSLSLRSLVAERDGSASDPPGAGTDSFTLDSEVSRLVAADQVTIIRGGGRSTSAADARSAARRNP
jgi:pilus assembly protein CpaB